MVGSVAVVAEEEVAEVVGRGDEGTGTVTEPSGNPLAARVAAVAGLALYGLVGGVPYLVSGLVVPPVAHVILLAVWGVGLVYAVRIARTKPYLSLVAAPLALVFWVVYVQGGSLIFGWTA